MKGFHSSASPSPCQRKKRAWNRLPFIHSPALPHIHLQSRQLTNTAKRRIGFLPASYRCLKKDNFRHSMTNIACGSRSRRTQEGRKQRLTREIYPTVQGIATHVLGPKSLEEHTESLSWARRTGSSGRQHAKEN